MLSAKLVKALEATMPGSETIKHSDAFTAGIPDLSHSWFRITTWAEVKLDKGKGVKSRKIQERLCGRLARSSRCVYVVYSMRSKQKNVTIRHPTGNHPLECPILREFQGFDHAAVAEYIRSEHLLCLGLAA